MCEACEALAPHISSLIDAIKVGSSDDWETSEPMCIGGPGSTAGNTYSCRAPFRGECQWEVDIATCGASQSQVIISSTRKTSGVDYSGTQPGFSELTPFDGFVCNLAPNQTTPVDSEWYNVRDSNNTIYVLIINAGGASAFVNLQFRQKRGK